MGKRNIRVLAGVGAVLAAVVLSGAPAFAGTITTPTAPFTAPLNAAGTGPAPFKIVGSGYTPGTQAQVIICDGTPSTTPGWDPTINCDNGTAPQNQTVQANGTVTWDPANINTRIGVFDGTSPSFSFNCYYPGETAFKNGAINPANGLPSWENCQVRVSSNNAAVTSDQAFVTFTLPKPNPMTPETPFPILLPIGTVLLLAGGYVVLRRRQHSTTSPA